MNKKFLSAVLFGALMVTSTGTFVSCKDYDDDIDQINKELTDIKSAISELQKKVGDGKFVTNVVKDGDGIKITWNDNSTSTIETIKGADGKNGTIVTIVDGYWAFDGVKSAYPAKGDKGEDGAAAAAGHDAKISADGYWMVWDSTLNGGKGDYKKTEYIAGGATAVAGQHGWTIFVRDDKGEMQSIYVPNSASLLSIEPVKDNIACNYNIYYGVLTADAAWDGAKAVDGKMQKGMYPTLDRDVNVLLNPAGVDATNYKFDFKGSDNKELWGLTFGEMKPYEGEKLTRAASTSGIWTLPRNIERVELDEFNAKRATYVTQFKTNDNKYYALSMNATSIDDATNIIKSQYEYQFNPLNIGSLDAAGFGYIKSEKNTYTWGAQHGLKFDANNWTAGTTATGLGVASLSSVLYDYKLSINQTTMTKVLIDKYGLEIVDNGYKFIAKKEAAVDNWIDLKVSYILVNGSKATKDISVYITASDIAVESNNIGSIDSKFNASLQSFDASKVSMPAALNGKYVYNQTLAFNLAEKLGANKDQWIDAMYNNLRGQTNDVKAKVLKFGATLIGGDPINNVAEYNNALLDNLVYFDYVDKDGKSCIYNVKDADLIASLEKVAGLKVYFIAGTYNPVAETITSTTVKAPYYTVSGTQNWSNGFAIPLNNAFSVAVAATKEQQTVAKLDFTFQLTMPDNCPIKRQTVGNQTTKWNADKNLLTIYGQKNGASVNVDMRDAFVGAFQVLSTPDKTEDYTYDYAYGPMKPEAAWYKITWPSLEGTTNNAVLIGVNLSSLMLHTVALSEIENTAEYKNWNTYGNIARVFDMLSEDRPIYTTEAVEYDHFGVYSESLKNFSLKFASKVEDSQKAGLAKDAVIEAKATYEANGVDVKNYSFSVSNASFGMTDAFNNAYYLFDDAAAKRGTKHVKLNEATQGIETALKADGSRNATEIEANMFGLYPEVRVDTKTVFSALGTTIVGTPVNVELVKDATSGNYTGMKFTIPGAYANDKKFEITYNVRDVFGTVKTFKFYARTVNTAIGEDNKPVGEK